MTVMRRTRSRRPRKVTPRLIRLMARRLVRQFDPEQIILFGPQMRSRSLNEDIGWEDIARPL